MDRQPPRTTSNAIELYMRTYYSLLRSSGDVRVRAFEEAHAFSDSSLHAGAREQKPDTAAFAYSAARLPSCMTQVRRLVAGQSMEQFEAEGFDVRTWQGVTARGRRRPSFWDGAHTLAVFITSVSDIDDLVPIVTAYQIEWNKMHARLSRSEFGTELLAGNPPPELTALELATEVGDALGIELHEVDMLESALAGDLLGGLRAIVQRPRELSLRLIAGTLVEYRRASQRWWQGIESAYRAGGSPRPVYFVSSNTHALPNLIGGYARAHRDQMLAFVRDKNPEGLSERVADALAAGNEEEINNICYYLLRRFINDDAEKKQQRTEQVGAFDQESGLSTLTKPGHLDVNVQLIELCKIRPERLDPRIDTAGLEALKQSEAVIINIDYPLGMAAYHHLTQLAQGVGEIRGMYLMGKAATLNGRVGDVMLSTVAHDEHSQNTYLFGNCFSARHLAPLVSGTVLDNQKALTVRGSFLQNPEYMDVFYHDGYTVLEMEAGPYLSAVYEMVYPKRHPTNEIIHLSTLLPFDFGLVHYASDTPYSRRQSLLSKSLSYFGVDSTYGCAIAIMRRIFELEVARVRG